MLYTYGGTPSDVLTTPDGTVVPDYPVRVRVAGTGETVTALYEADGVTPIGELRSNPAGSAQPGAIRTFKIDGIAAIEFEYLDAGGNPLRWYEQGREVAQQALEQAQDALRKSEGGTVEAPLTAADGMHVEGGLDVAGGANVDTLHAEGTISAGGGVDLSGMRIYNPRILGAKGDGVANDSPAIQAALTAATAAGGGWVIVPAGTYRLATLPLRIYRNTRFTLLPGARFVRAAGATMLLNGDADQNLPGYTGHGNITVEGGVWDMQATAAGLTASRMCMSFGHGERITVRGAEIRDVPGFHAVEVNACKGVLIEGCRFLGFTDPGGRDISEAVQIDLASEVGAFGGFGPYDMTVCDDVEITGCYFGASGTPGTTAWPRGIGCHNARVTLWQRDVRIIGNTFQGLLQYGVHGYNWRDVTITGNTFRGCGAGVRMRTIDTAKTAHTQLPDGAQTSASQPMRDINITGNTITGSTGYDDVIHIEGEATGRLYGLTIDDNTIDGQTIGKHGLRMISCNDFTVSDNTITAVDGSAVSQQDCIGGTIADSRIMQPNASGLSLNSCTRVKMTGNAISEPGVQGVWLVGGSVLTVENNLITSPSRAAAGAGYGIRISSSATDVRITGNTVRRHGSGNEMGYALSITSACSGIRRWGNDLPAGTLGAIDDQSPNPITTPGDITTTLHGRPTLATAANTTAETVVASWTIPAGDAIPNVGYSFLAQGVASTTGTPTLTIRVRLGGVAGAVIAQYTAVTTASAIANRGWRVEGSVHCLSAGASATWAGGATLYHHLASATGAAQYELTDAAVTRDSTVDQTLVVTAQWSVASASNTASASAGRLQRLN
ncbi:right-handed parallel beta-helix repeat-containing protein [Streptomyces sp. NPDC001356]